MAEKKTVEELSQTDILEVAQALGMDLKRSGRHYIWTEHDSFVITPGKNMFSWFSRDTTGNVFDLVRTVKEEQSGQAVSFKEAKHFLETGEFKTFEASVEPQKPFSYYLQRYENAGFKQANDYLINERGLSQDTIDFFRSKGVLVQANHKTGNVIEPVVVFKTFDPSGKVTGASLQGIQENKKLHDRGRLKQLMRASDGLSGMHVDIGQPKRLIVAEAPIDLMSYYELHKDNLQDVRLLAMDGLKEGAISRHFVEVRALNQGLDVEIDRETAPKFLETIAKTTKFFDNPDNHQIITLAIDNDDAGHRFVSKLQNKGIAVQVDIPKISVVRQDKNDWNDFLKKESGMSLDVPGVHFYYLDQTGKEVVNRYGGYYSQEVAEAHLHVAQLHQVPAIISSEILQASELPKATAKDWETFITNHPDLAPVKQESYRLRQARQKLARLEREFEETISDVFTHTRIRNGQPRMPWRQQEQTWMREDDRLNNKARRLQGELTAQQERVEMLEQKEVSQATGLNRQGRGLAMTVDNIPNIRAELAKADRGEASYSAATIRKYRKELTRLEAMQEQMATVTIQPGTQAIIDQGLVNQWQKQPNLYFIKGLRRVALELTKDGTFTLGKTYLPQTDKEKATVEDLLQRQFLEQGPEVAHIKEKGESMSDKTTALELTDIRTLHAKWEKELSNKVANHLGRAEVTFWEVEAERGQFLTTELDQLFAKRSSLEADAHYADNSQYARQEIRELDEQILVTLKKEAQEKALEGSQELSAESNFGGFPDVQEAAPLPEADYPQPLEGLSPDQPQSQPLLHFSTKADPESSPYKKNYHAVTDKELRKLNRYAPTIQETAKWYLDNLADSQVTYFYQDGNEVKSISIDYLKENFMHLTGLAPTGPGQTPEKTLVDLAQGKGEFDHLLIANKGATFDKLKVLPELQAITEAESFFFGDLSSVERLHSLELDKAIRSSDKDLLLALRSVDDGDGSKHFPASLLRLKEKLNIALDATRSEKTILGVFRHRDGVVDTLSVNQDYIKDNGKAMKAMLENGGLEPLEEGIKALKAKVVSIERPKEITYQAGDVVTYEAFAEEFHRLNNDIYPEHQAILEATGRISPHLPYHTVVIDLLDGDGNVVQSDIRLTIGQEKDGIAAHLKEGIDPELKAAIEEMDLALNPISQEAIKKTSVFENLRDRAGKLFQNFRSTPQESLPTEKEDGVTTQTEKPQEETAETPQTEESVKVVVPEKKETVQEDATISSLPQSDSPQKDDIEATAVVKPDDRTVAQIIADRDTKALSQHMKEGVKNYFSSERYKTYLETLAKLPHYSDRNIRLLMAQRSDLTAVASANSWKKDFGRLVNKGEKALWIWAPKQVLRRDKETGEPILNEDGKQVYDTRFNLVPVFDVSQTNGKDLGVGLKVLEGDHKGYASLYQATKSVAEELGVQVEISQDLPSDAEGVYRRSEAKIILRSGQSEQATLHTLFHELAHVQLDHGGSQQDLTRSTEELQAESLAYVVSSHFGIDTSEVSFDYLASWSQDKEGLQDLEAQLKIVQKEASELIQKLDQSFEKYQAKDLSKTNAFAEKLDRFKQASQEKLNEKNEVQKDPKKDLGSHQLSPNLP